jgi:hypothetical protein
MCSVANQRLKITTGLASLVFCLSLIAGVAIAQTVEQNPPLPPTRVDPKAKEILDRVIQALGGPAFMNFKRLTTRGRLFSISDEGGSYPLPFEGVVEFPDKRRLVVGKKNPVTLINNGDKAWEIDRMGLTHQLPDQIYRWKLTTLYGLENLLRLRIHEPGMLIQQGGVDFVDNVPTLGVVVSAPRGVTVRIDVHRHTYLPVRISFRVQNPKTREWEDYADVYGDYRDVQGIKTPMQITRYLNGDRISAVFRNEARYDEEYPPGYFQPSG